MKVTLEDKLKFVRFMEHATGMTDLLDKGFTYADICDHAETQYQEAKGVAKWPASAHAKDSKAPSSSFTCNKAHSLVQFFQKRQSASWPCDKSNNTCNLCRETGCWANQCPNKAHFTMKPHTDTTMPNRCSFGPSSHPGIHVGTLDTTITCFYPILVVLKISSRHR